MYYELCCSLSNVKACFVILRKLYVRIKFVGSKSGTSWQQCRQLLIYLTVKLLNYGFLRKYPLS
jgi:hypothetical protein